MIIKITNYPVGIHDLRFEKTADELQLGEPFIDNLILDLKLDKSHHQILMSGNLTISAHLNCDRCNENYKSNFNSDFTLLYLFNQDRIHEDDVNVKYLSPKDDKIDITADVIDYARLSLPMKQLCSEDCKGLCMKCGANLNHSKCSCVNDNIDPTWEQLKKLKDKLN
ncbi:MAG: DUF177 domain-containing protein [Melioribacteraceae bacterium]|nr:DUF177 domain-containing protein [Melioribacteraceae bacterium]